MNKQWCLRFDGKVIRFTTLYEAVSYAEDHELRDCSIEGPVLTTKENLEQLETVKQYFIGDATRH